MMIIDYPWYYVLLCLLLGAAYAAVLYFVGPASFTRRLRWVLSVLRFLAVSAIAFLLLAPLSKQNVTERQLPQVVLLRDVSQSVVLGADSSFSFNELAKGLESHCRITIDSFGTAGHTDIGDALDRYRNDDVAALVLASDGIHNRGAHPTTVAEKLSFPIYCVALGDTTPQRDAALTNLRCNRIAMLSNSFPVEFTVASTLLKGHEVRLTVTDARGKQLHMQAIRYDDDDFSQTLTVNLMASEPGLQRYTLRLGAVEDEVSMSNNELSFFVDVIDTRQRVAIFANAPHPDLAALKRALESNPNYEAEIVLADDVERGKWKASDDLSLAILHNLPSQRHPSITFAKELPQLYIIGLQTDLARFNALHTGLELLLRFQGQRARFFALLARCRRCRRHCLVASPFGTFRRGPHQPRLADTLRSPSGQHRHPSAVGSSHSSRQSTACVYLGRRALALEAGRLSNAPVASACRPSGYTTDYLHLVADQPRPTSSGGRTQLCRRWSCRAPCPAVQ